MASEKERSKISKFKKFSQISGYKTGEGQEPQLPVRTSREEDLPANPNLPNSSTKREVTADISYMQPRGQKTTQQKSNPKTEEGVDENVQFVGKVAKFPQKTRASKALNFLERVKISKDSIWYILVEKQDNELQMLKYNYQKGVDLNKFVGELKSYYLSKYTNNGTVSKLIENITVEGNDKFSIIKNIPKIEIEGRGMIARITEDLIKLLAK